MLKIVNANNATNVNANDTTEVNCDDDDFVNNSAKDIPNASYESNQGLEPNISADQTTKFQITLSRLVWNRIQPEKWLYRDQESAKNQRNYSVLKSGAWTSIIAQQIARQQKHIHCKWTFKRSKVYEHGRHFITISGSCVTCKASLTGYLKDKPESPEKLIRFNFEAKNIDQEIHKDAKEQRNVRIGGDFANDIYGRDEPASATRRHLLSKSTSMFQDPIDRVLTAPAIRSGKYRLRQLNLLHDCPITSLNILKMEVYRNWIQNIGLNPFYVIYSYPEQIALLKAHKRKQKKIEVSCDATGGVANKIGIVSIDI